MSQENSNYFQQVAPNDVIKELQKAKVLNESIVNTSQDGILVVDPFGKAITFNHRFAELFRIPQEILKTHDGNKFTQYSLQHLKEPQKFVAGVKTLLTHKEQKSNDEVPFKDGSFLARYSAPLLDLNNNYLGRVWFFRDISSEKQTLEKILNQKIINDSIINTSIDGILVVDKQGKAITFNTRFAELFGIPQDVLDTRDGNKMTQYSLAKLKYPKKFIQGIKDLFLDAKLKSSDEVEFKDGRFLDRYSSPLTETSGKLLGRVWFFRDITERKRTAEARYQNIFENSPGALGEADFSELKIYLTKLQNKGINNIELYLKTHKGEIANCIKLIKFTDINTSFLKLYEVNNKNEFIQAFFSRLEKEKLDMAIALVSAVANNQKAFNTDLEDTNQQNNKIEVILQYKISPGYEDFSKILISMIDVTQLKRIEKQLAYSAVHDPLTNLPNRILFNETINNSIYRSQRTSTKVALLYLDVDNFKTINDNFGHDVGDLILVEVGNRLKTVLRRDDFVARLGGDEFAIILNALNEISQAGTVAKKIINKINGEYSVTNNKLSVTVSIGIAVYPDSSENIADLIKYADRALYSVKSSGKNNYNYHLKSTSFFPKIDLEAELISALHQQQFFVVYQPQYNVSTNKMVGIEAFIRWQHEELGLVFPDNFFPLIENNDLIVEIGHWLLETCCTQYAKWLQIKPNLPPLTINLSFKQLLQDNFSLFLKNVFQETKVKPEQLIFDLNESTFINNPTQMSNIIQQLKSIGVRISLDNIIDDTKIFSQAHALGIETIKIAQSLISLMLGDVNVTKKLQQILNAAKQNGLQVVAIGVESKAQINYLLENSCFLMQGYYLSKPLLTSEINATLQAEKFF